MSSAADVLVFIVHVVASWLMLRAWRAGDVMACARGLWRIIGVCVMIAARYFVVEAADLRAVLSEAVPLMIVAWLACWGGASRASHRARIGGGIAAQIQWWICGSWGWGMAAGAASVCRLVACGALRIAVPVWPVIMAGLGGAGAVVCAVYGLMKRDCVWGTWGCAACACVSGPATAAEWYYRGSAAGAFLFAGGAANVIVLLCGSAAALLARKIRQT